MIRTVYGPQGSTINLDGKTVINLASNNYLGLASHPALKEAAKKAIDDYGLGPAAGRTIVGNLSIYNELEARLARFKDVEDTIVFHSGLSANAGAIPALFGRGDTIYSDALNHASIIDACRLSRADTIVYSHLDVDDLRRKLRAGAPGNKLIVTDAVFSMDGDLAPVPELLTLAREYGATFLLDDAHGDGVMGPHGRGTAAHFGLAGEIDLETGSFSKAFGASGGFVAGRQDLIDQVRAKARSFMFTSTLMPPAMSAAVITALALLEQDDTLVRRLWENREYFATRLASMGYDTGSSRSPILPVYTYDEDKAEALCQSLYDAGVFAQAIRYPMVAKGAARLRVILSAAHSREELDTALAAFAQVGKALQLL